MLQDIPRGRDKETNLDILILNFSKVLNTVPHTWLLKKLESYGVKGNIRGWNEARLADRQQQVVLVGERSEPVWVWSGVPQGTVFDPLMFFLYINDICNNISHSYMHLLAKHCLLYREISRNKEKQIHDETSSRETSIPSKTGPNLGRCNSIRVVLIHYFLLAISSAYHRDTRDNIGSCRPVW